MEPQYVAGQSSSAICFAASRSQAIGFMARRLQRNPLSGMVIHRSNQVTYTSRGADTGDVPTDLPHNCDRRLRCPRASNCWPFSALHSQRPLARAKHRLKSSLWLTPRRSPSSQHIQASTSKLVWGQASAPVPTRPVAPRTGGASWL